MGGGTGVTEGIFVVVRGAGIAGVSVGTGCARGMASLAIFISFYIVVSGFAVTVGGLDSVFRIITGQTLVGRSFAGFTFVSTGFTFESHFIFIGITVYSITTVILLTLKISFCKGFFRPPISTKLYLHGSITTKLISNN